MYGGLKKSASRLALVAAAGVLSTGAYAADLGGDCCADLEERVAELEATTARKGNRKVSLTISGQVNRAIMYYNDGNRSNTFFGLDNSNSSTRFGLTGSAKITPTVSAGYSILIDVRDKGRTTGVSQASGDDATSQERSGNANGDHLIRMRDANWWLESSAIGRLTVGRLVASGPTGTLDLGGISVVAAGGEGCIGNSLEFRNSAGALSGVAIGTATMGCAVLGTRQEGVRYNSPTFAGFTFSATIGENATPERNAESGVYSAVTGGGSNGRFVGADLRYAGEFSGVRVAGSVGWQKSEGNDDDGGTQLNGDSTVWGVAGSLLHVPTGLFVQAEYVNQDHTVANNTLAGSPITTFSASADRWHVQGGIRQNFFGIGATSLYGEYGRHNGFLFLNTQSATTGLSASSLGGDTATIWGLGIVQEVDAANMQLYLGYRNYSVDGTSIAGGLKDIDVVAGGARIRF